MQHPIKHPVVSDTLKMYVHEEGDEYVSKSIREHGYWEPYETSVLASFIKPGSTFVDVGANIGYYSLIASQLTGPNGLVFAFEPAPQNFSLLQKNIQLNALENVVAYQAGLSNAHRLSDLYLSDDNWGDHRIFDSGLERTSCEIQLSIGDEVLQGVTDKINVLKIDTQGAEYQVVTGLDKMIRRSLDDLCIAIEFWPFGLKKSGSHGHELLDLLLSYNLPMAIIDHIDDRLIPCLESDLRPWVDELDQQPENEGFLNLLIANY